MPATISTKFFNGRMTASDMKTKYRKLALEWHPDINHAPNALEMMKLINAEFSYWYSRAATEQVKEEKKDNNPGKAEYYDTRYAQQFMESLEQMINWIYSENIDRIDGLTVELIGVFIWIGGVKPEHTDIRAKIKSVGFQGSWKRTDDNESVYMWKWTPEIKRFNSEENIDTIRKHYGSVSQNRKGQKSQTRQLKG